MKFVLVGISNNVVAFSVFYLLSRVGYSYFIAFTLCYAAGILNSYIWNKFWTFQSKDRIAYEFFKFTTIYLIAYAVNLAMLAFLIEVFVFNANLSLIISTGLTTLFSFIGHKRWSFRRAL